MTKFPIPSNPIGSGNLMGGFESGPIECGLDDNLYISTVDRFKSLKRDEKARFAVPLFNTRADGSSQPRIIGYGIFRISWSDGPWEYSPHSAVA